MIIAGGFSLGSDVSLPLWLLIILITFAFIMLLDRVLMPSVKWYFRRKVQTMLKEVRNKLEIPIKPFQLTKKRVLVDRLVFDDKVVQALKKYAEKHDMPLEVAQQKAYEYASEIAPKFNAYLYFKFGYWLAQTISRMIYRIRVGKFDQRQLSDVSEDASIVFVMNHRSNMDYMLVSFLVANKTALSYAVGEWARVWPLQSLVRALGAFFVRRNSKNSLYRTILERYVHLATRAGVSQAVYLEGGLSKDGRLRKPKLGFLDYMFRDFDPEEDKDVLLVPVGLNYDRVIEDKSLARGLDKKLPKRSRWFVIKTSIGFALKTLFMQRKKRWRRFGYAGVNFGKPISAKAYFAKLNQQNAGISSKEGALKEFSLKSLSKEQRIEQVKTLADELMQQISQVVPVLPVALLAEVLLKSADSPLDKEQLLTQSISRIKALKEQGAPINISENAYEGVLSIGLNMLIGRKFVLCEKGAYQVQAEALPLLNYYAHSIAHWNQ